MTIRTTLGRAELPAIAALGAAGEEGSVPSAKLVTIRATASPVAAQLSAKTRLGFQARRQSRPSHIAAATAST